MTRPTLRIGSTGVDVRDWQKIVGVKVDGDFGPLTENATRLWQKQHKLVPDGVVGPNTWGMALGEKPTTVSKSPAANTDEWAYGIVKLIPDYTNPEREYLLTIARGEGFYGKGWKDAGADSNNWGAVQGNGPAGSFMHIDHHADGTAYQGTFKKYLTPEQGARDMGRILLKDNVRKEVNRGNLKGAVYAQHSNGYFELDPAKYLLAVESNYRQLTANLGWPKLLSSVFWKVIGLFRKASWVSDSP